MTTAHTVSVREAAAHSPGYQAYKILHWGFVVAPAIAGLDKFAHMLTNWTQYLAPQATRVTGLTAETFMMVVGVVEVAAALLVAFKPRIGGYVVAAWLWAIIVNLFLLRGYYDIALRDLGLSLGALALARLSSEYGRR
jgi:hypothetical protein